MTPEQFIAAARLNRRATTGPITGPRISNLQGTGWAFITPAGRSALAQDKCEQFTPGVLDVDPLGVLAAVDFVGESIRSFEWCAPDATGAP